jgi:tetratricopeptide (TPR) repeat protein
MHILADACKADPDRYEQAYTQVCRFKPDYYLSLGDYLVEHQRGDSAAKAYQKAVDHAPDRVAVSNNVRWLVDYYYEHDRRKEAFVVAEMAAEAYSARGLETMAMLLERDGQLAQAETYFNKITERYDQSGQVMAFYSRHRDNAQFAAAFDRAMAKVFPQGEEPANIPALAAAPTDGVVLTGTNRTVNEAGMKQGDVIVAVNGVRARNSAQYRYLLDRAKSPRIQLAFWSTRNYRSVVVNLPERRLGVSISDLRR